MGQQLLYSWLNVWLFWLFPVDDGLQIMLASSSCMKSLALRLQSSEQRRRVSRMRKSRGVIIFLCVEAPVQTSPVLASFFCCYAPLRVFFSSRQFFLHLSL